MLAAPIEVLARWTVPEPVLFAINTLKKNSYQAWLVGGSVRDMLRGHPPKDFDITTDARPWEIRQLFARSRVIGRRFPIVHVRYNKQLMEISTLRRMAPAPRTASSSHQVPGNQHYGNSIGVDIMGRDYTINALYYDPVDLQVRGHMSSYRDIQNRRIRSITDPNTSFDIDPVRMLRALYFCARLDFSLDSELAKAIRSHAGKIATVSRGRMHHELEKIFSSKHSARIWALLGQYGFIKHLFPDLAPLVKRRGQHCHIEVGQFVQSLFDYNDREAASGKPVNYSFLLAALLWYPLQLSVSGRQAKAPTQRALVPTAKYCSRVLGRQHAVTAILWRQKRRIMDIWAMQDQLIALAQKADTVQISRIAHEPGFRDGLALLLLRSGVEPALHGHSQVLRKFGTRTPTRCEKAPGATSRIGKRTWKGRRRARTVRR